MTPKEKAEELVRKMCLNDCTDKNIYTAKQCALIAVDEILNVIYRDTNYQNSYAFFLDVKQEIEKL